jgi:hypothetical protein
VGQGDEPRPLRSALGLEQGDEQEAREHYWPHQCVAQGAFVWVLGPLEVVSQDFTGSGAATAAHARENGRIVVMFCSQRSSGLHQPGRAPRRGVPGNCWMARRPTAVADLPGTFACRVLAPLGSGAGSISSKAARTRAMASSHASQSQVGPPPCRIHAGDPSRPEDTRPKSVSAASFGLASAQQVIY